MRLVRHYAGGLIFGWNSLALIIKQQGNFACVPPTPTGMWSVVY